jgi:ABC-type uncharacterized transport system fused permease/ATPase subunit
MRRAMRQMGPVLRDAWMLSVPYFRSEEKWSAIALLVSTIALNLSLVGMTVVLNFWNGAFFDSIQSHDWHSSGPLTASCLDSAALQSFIFSLPSMRPSSANGCRSAGVAG